MKTKTAKKTNRGTLSSMNKIVKCRSCGKKTHSSIDNAVGVELCRKCYDLAGWENLHSDANHEKNPDELCPVCFREGLVKPKQKMTQVEELIASVAETAIVEKSEQATERFILVLVDENPKRGAAAERFSLYKDGMKVAEFRAAGGKAEDLRWDLKHGFIFIAE